MRIRSGRQANGFTISRRWSWRGAGGCVSWHFDFDSGTSATQAVAVGESLLLVSRVDLNESIRREFLDEEL